MDLLSRLLPGSTDLQLVTWDFDPSNAEINRLKMIKHQMFGRASFDLLNRRFKPYRVCRRLRFLRNWGHHDEASITQIRP